MIKLKHLEFIPVIFLIVIGIDYRVGWNKFENIPGFFVAIAGVYTALYVFMMLYLYSIWPKCC